MNGAPVRKGQHGNRCFVRCLDTIRVKALGNKWSFEYPLNQNQRLGMPI
jgi:hypothetical protein